MFNPSGCVLPRTRVHRNGKAIMSNDDTYDENDTDEGQGQQQNDGREIKNLRRAAEEGKRAKRENAFLRAGIDIDDTKMAYFVKGYDGELDPTAIKEAAVEAGFLAPAQQTQDPAVQHAQQAQQKFVQASEGSVPEYGEDGAQMALEKAYTEGGEDAMLEVAKQYGVPVNPRY